MWQDWSGLFNAQPVTRDKRPPPLYLVRLIPGRFGRGKGSDSCLGGSQLGELDFELFKMCPPLVDALELCASFEGLSRGVKIPPKGNV